MTEKLADTAVAAEPLRARQVILVSHGFQSNYERAFANGLAAVGAVPTLLASDRTDYHALLPGVEAVNVRGSQDERRTIATKVKNMLSYHARLMWFALAHRRHALHVIGLIEPVWLCGLIEGAWFRLVCRRYVLTVHNLLPHGRHSARNQRLYRLAYALPHRLVVHTDKMKADMIRQFGVDPSRIVVMEHGIEPIDDSHAMSDAYGALHGGPLSLLFFGKLARYKGLDLLLDALKNVPFEWRLTIAGSCTDAGLASEIAAAIKSHPGVQWISWRNDFIPEADMEQMFRSSGALVLPYRHIDQSGVLFQALRAGLPIVATRVGQFERYVSAVVGETCAPDDVQALREALVKLEARRGELSRPEIQSIGKQYEWPRTVVALAAAY